MLVRPRVTPTLIEVRRLFVPIDGASSPWAQHPFERTVWHVTIGAKPVTIAVAVPDGYLSGLLTGYINDREVDMHDLDEALKTVGVTRADIEQAIAELAPPDMRNLYAR